MPAAAELYPPVGYDGWWVALGVLSVALAVGLLGWALLPRRAAGSRRRAPRPDRVDLAQVRREHLGQIARVEDDWRAGRLGSRPAHQLLSTILRGYAGAATGVPAASMSADELAEHGLHQLSGAVRAMYPPEFGASPVTDAADRDWDSAGNVGNIGIVGEVGEVGEVGDVGDVGTAARAARELVSSWDGR